MAIKNTTVFTQGKGGVGKTTLTSNVAGLAAAAGYRTLAVDLDQQGNLARDFGFPPNSGEDLRDLLFKKPARLPLIKGVRDNLDVVPGGPAIADLIALFSSREGRRQGTMADALEEALGFISDDYDLIFIDTPPGDRLVVEAALAVATTAVIPTRSDDASIDGVAITAERFANVAEINPQLRLAGVVLFALNARSERVEADVRTVLNQLLEGSAPVFSATIRHLESAAVDARRNGLLVHELEQAGAAAKKERLADLRATKDLGPEERSAFLKSKRDTTLYSSSTVTLADDYAALTRELLIRIAELSREGD